MRMNKKNSVLITLFLAIFLVLLSGTFFMLRYNLGMPSRDALPSGKSSVVVGESVFTVDIAETSALREQGLSGRVALPEKGGMLFVFDKPIIEHFWMKDMNFPIDIVWIGDDMHVVDLSEHLTPESYPKIFSPRVPARYVLEIGYGVVAREKIKIGDAVEILR